MRARETGESSCAVARFAGLALCFDRSSAFALLHPKVGPRPSYLWRNYIIKQLI
jgi:hypothetical protein